RHSESRGSLACPHQVTRPDRRRRSTVPTTSASLSAPTTSWSAMMTSYRVVVRRDDVATACPSVSPTSSSLDIRTVCIGVLLSCLWRWAARHQSARLVSGAEVRYQDCALLASLATVLYVTQIIPAEAPRGGVGPTKKAWKHRETNRFQKK